MGNEDTINGVVFWILDKLLLQYGTEDKSWIGLLFNHRFWTWGIGWRGDSEKNFI